MTWTMTTWTKQMMERSEGMRASVRPLSGKHYGTTVDIVDGDKSFGVSVWIPEGRPSIAECAEWGITPGDWDENVEVPSGWSDSWVRIKSEFPCDSHYQSEYEARVAARIAWALDGWTP